MKDILKVKENIHEMITDIESAGMFQISLAPWSASDKGLPFILAVRVPMKPDRDIDLGADLILNGIQKDYLTNKVARNCNEDKYVSCITVYINSFNELCKFVYEVKKEYGDIGIYPVKTFTYSTYGMSEKLINTACFHFLGVELKEVIKLMNQVVEGETVDEAIHFGYKFPSVYTDIGYTTDPIETEALQQLSMEKASLFLMKHGKDILEYSKNDGLPATIKKKLDEFNNYIEHVADEPEVQTTTDEDYSNFIGAWS